ALQTESELWCWNREEFDLFFFFFQAEDGIRDRNVTGVQTCALPISERGLTVGVSLHRNLFCGPADPNRETSLRFRATASGFGAERPASYGSVPAIRQLLLGTCSCGRDSGEGMARRLRIQYPGAVYHVMNRGDRRESIFHDAADRQRVIETLGEVCGKTEI